MSTHIKTIKGRYESIKYPRNLTIVEYEEASLDLTRFYGGKRYSIAEKFFDVHPELLTEEDIENIASGGIEGDEVDDLKVIYKDYPDIQELLDILNEYLDDGCGVLSCN